jgi:hypothetical protein
MISQTYLFTADPDSKVGRVCSGSHKVPIRLEILSHDVAEEALGVESLQPLLVDSSRQATGSRRLETQENEVFRNVVGRPNKGGYCRRWESFTAEDLHAHELHRARRTNRYCNRWHVVAS